MLRAGFKRRCLDGGAGLGWATLPTEARRACLADARQCQRSAHNPNESLKVERFSGIAICLVALLLAVLRGGELSAQMLDMVQPVRNQVLLNPALVGNSDRMRADLFYRNQWLNANSPYNTFGLTYDLHFGVYDNHALGASVVNDVQGQFTLQHTSALAYYSYVVDISYNMRLTASYFQINWPQTRVQPSPIAIRIAPMWPPISRWGCRQRLASGSLALRPTI